jgi:hypothetical protein
VYRRIEHYETKYKYGIDQQGRPGEGQGPGLSEAFGNWAQCVKSTVKKHGVAVAGVAVAGGTALARGASQLRSATREVASLAGFTGSALAWLEAGGALDAAQMFRLEEALRLQAIAQQGVVRGGVLVIGGKVILGLAGAYALGVAGYCAFK